MNTRRLSAPRPDPHFPSMKRPTLIRHAFASLLLLAAVSKLSANTPPVLMAPDSVVLPAIKTEKDPDLSIDTSTGAPLLRVVFPANSGFPGINLPIPGGTWDLSAFSGIEAEVANVGQARINLGLRVDNPGDWKKSPWNTNNIWLAPGEAKVLRLTFGESFGRPAFALDPSRVSGVKIFLDNPKQDAPVLIKSIRAFGSPSAAASPAPAAATAAAPAAAVTGAAPIFTPSADNLSSIKTEKNPVLSIDSSGGAPALKVEFSSGGGYPGLDLPLPGGSINLSAFAGIEAEVTNLGQSTVNVNLRADNPGDWRQEPWNTNGAWIPAGRTQNVRLTFGESHGKPGYALDPSRIGVIKLFAGNPKPGSAILVRNIRPFGTAGVRETAPARGATPAPAAGADATYSPSIGGELIDLSKTDPLAGFRFSDSSAQVRAGQVHVTFKGGSNYPNIQFPIPRGGWDLSAFGAIDAVITNPGDRRVTAFLRVDNPGDWKTEPWNTENLIIEAGATKTLRLTFGQQNGAPAFPLNPKRISGVQLFIVRPKQDVTLVVSDLRAAGSPAAATDSASLTTPADRDIPVTPPAWLGQRPPVEGDWVKTLDENFDGDSLNEKLWTPRFPWDGPQPGQLQRYAPENVTVANGRASFKAEKKHGHENNDPKLGTREYTSGLIQSYDKWAQLYGYFEARVKLPTARGLWPAFWMMPDRGAASGLDTWRRRDTGSGAMEIDILEHLTEWGPGRNNVALHWDGYGDKHKAWGTSHVYFGPTSDGWHNFGVLWEPGKLTWFIDGKKVAVYENERVSNVASYLKLNIQMGGWATKDVDVARLPDFMHVDYVRAWQLRSRLQQ